MRCFNITVEKPVTEVPVIQYRIVHHVPGRVRVKVPSIKGLSRGILSKLANVPVPRGILKIFPNSLTGSLSITYDPAHINIEKYLQDMAASEEIENVLKRRPL